MFQPLLARLALAAALLASGAAIAGACPAYYVDGRLPEIRNPKLASATRELCYGEFGVMHSGVTRTPLWSAEYLKADNIEAAHALTRENSFHAEPLLPPGQRAELSDYAHSGFDRGHMSPNGDMPDRQAQQTVLRWPTWCPRTATTTATSGPASKARCARWRSRRGRCT